MSSRTVGATTESVSAALLVGTLASVYMVSQFLRNSVGVIAPNLAEEIGLSAADIGLLSSAFFFSFAAAQVPLGIALDRVGPRRSMLVCAVVAVIGAVTFSIATTPLGLILARALLGLGSSCFLMAPLALYARRFQPDRFATLAGLQVGIGTLGTLLATAPLAFATAAIGWRATFLLVAAIVVASAFAIVVVVPRDGTIDPHPSAPKETLREGIAGVLEAWRVPSVWRLFLMHLTAYSSFVLIVGLWGGPYLTHVYGYGLKERGDLLLIPALGQVLGSILWGRLPYALGNHKVPVTAGALMTASSLGLLAIGGKLAPTILIVWLTVYGVICAYTPAVIAHGKSLFPSHLVGRGLTLLNMGTMGGVFVSQAVSGAVINVFASGDGVYPLIAYRVVFALQAGFVIASCLYYFAARDPGARTA
jgi:MFS family permease